MLFSEKLKLFKLNHVESEMNIDGFNFKYISSGDANKKTIVFFEAGDNNMYAWMDYCEKLDDSYSYLIFKYPSSIDDAEKLITLIHQMLENLKIKKPILIGCSEGTIEIQLYNKKYPEDVDSMILINPCGLDNKTIKYFKRRKLLYRYSSFVIKRSDYLIFAKNMINIMLKKVRKYTPELEYYIKDALETIYFNMTKEEFFSTYEFQTKLLYGQQPLVSKDFKNLDGKILVIYSKNNYPCPKKLNMNLLDLVKTNNFYEVKGTHYVYLAKVDEYMKYINEFLNKNYHN